jgi:hypothetical protein
LEIAAAGIPLQFKHDGEIYSVWEVRFVERLGRCTSNCFHETFSLRAKPLMALWHGFCLVSVPIAGRSFTHDKRFGNFPTDK